MKLSIDSFRGEAPILTPRALPPNAAQEATNCRMHTGDLESWRQYLATKVLANAGPVRTIYLLKDKWLSWDQQVDVARGIIPGDDTYRTYLTCPSLYATPRWTNYALATTGAEPYPVVTRPIGVPAPDTAPTLAVGPDTSSSATFSVDITDTGDDAPSWTFSPHAEFHGGVRDAYQDITFGNPAGSYQLLYDDNPGAPAYIYRDFGIGKAAVVEVTWDAQMTSGSNNQAQMCAGLMRVNDGSDGLLIYFDSMTNALYIGKAPGWNRLGQTGLASDPASVGFAFDAWYSFSASIKVNTDGTCTVTAKAFLASTEIASVTTTLTATLGGFVGFYAEVGGSDPGGGNDGVDRYRTYIDNIHVKASGTAGYAPLNTATSYVYTFRNDLLEESAPSPVSETILRPDGVSVTVTTPTTTPVGTDPDYGITEKVIYRAVTGSGGTAFQRVAVIPLATATYTDMLDDSETGPQILESAEWDLPPADLEGIIVLPNGVMAGYVRNQLCLSAPNRPHAWPVRNRFTTDTDITGICGLDNTVVIGTQSFVYTATGVDPANYSMSKPGAPQACVSKRSMVYLDGKGVVFASPDGLQLCAGSAGQVANMTEGIFEKRQWEAIKPTSIISAVHDGKLFFFYDTGTAASGYVLDMRANGFGLGRLSCHATAPYVDPLTDGLYLVLDQNNEPTNVLLPIPSSAVTPNGHTIFQFDADPSNNLVYRWRGKLNEMPFPTTLLISELRALLSVIDNLVFRVYGDGVLIYERRIASEREFVLPGRKTYDSYEFEFIGTTRVKTHQAAEDVMELT